MPTEATTPALPSVPPRRVRLRVVLVALLALALLLVLAVPLGLFAGLRSEAGTAWLLARTPGLDAAGLRGALLGDRFSAERLTWLLPGTGDLLVLEDVAWEGLRVSRSPDAGQWVAVNLTRLQARRATLTLAPRPPSTTPSSPPASLRLPVAVQIDALSVGEFRTAALGEQPLRDIAARLAIGIDGGARHRIDGLQLAWDRLQASGSLQIGSDAPLPLELQLQLAPSTTVGAASAPASAAASGAERGTPAAAPTLLEDWQADLRLAGPLARPSLKAQVRRGGTAPASLLDAEAVLLPFAAWPLADLQARTRDLDLAAFASAAPRTALSGEATVNSTGLDQAASADVALENSAAGLWNEGKLPLRSLRLRVQARPDRPQVATIDRFEAELGSTARAAGRLSGRGSIDGARWTVDTTLEDLAPHQLDARAAPMRLAGNLALAGGPAAEPTPASGAGSTGSPTAAVPPSAAASGVTVLSARGTLTGRVEARATAAAPGRPRRAGPAATPRLAAASPGQPPVQLVLDARARLGPNGALQLDLQRADGSAGKASARLAGVVSRADAAAPWQIQGRASLADFDPRPWWAGPEGSPWRRGPHRLNADAVVDLRVNASAATASPAAAPRTARPPPAADAASQALFAALAPWRGQATLTLKPSVLAGVALEGEARLNSGGAPAGPAEADASVKLLAAGNRLNAQLRSRADRPAADRLQLEVDAPALAALAPAAALFGLTSSATSLPALSGRVTGQATLDGRWPGVRTEGRLEAQAVRAGQLALQRGALRWQLGTQSDAPAELQADLTQLKLAEMTADAASLRLSGTARAHRLTLTADSRALPPDWVSRLNGPAPAGDTSAASTPATAAATSPSGASLRAEGGLVFAAGSGSTLTATGWRGQVQELSARSGSTPAQALGLRSTDLSIEFGWAAGAPARLAVQPGRVELQAGATTAALRWSRLAWQAAPAAAAGATGGAGSQIDVEAELEPIAVAPLLRRFQPDFGWGGDLQVGGKLSLQSAPRLRADIVLERRRGDLNVTDEIGIQALGLSDLRFGVNAENGVWSFTQALAGTTIGVAAGAVVARPGSPTAWPTADTPIQGVLELRVANLGAWGPWVPAGWRLGGALQTSASIGGRLGAPEYTGSVRGNGLTVRNFAEGVNVADGEIDIALQGASARIVKASAKAGKGTVQLTGGASFGSAPQARLSLRADQFQLLGRVDRRIVASGQGQLTLEADKITLDGQFGVDEGLVDFTRGDAPSLSDDVVVIRPPKGSGQAAAVGQQVAEQKAGAAASRIGSEAATARKVGAPAAKPPPTRAVALNLRVNLGNQLRLRGRGLDTGLRGELLITSPGGRLTVNGTVSTEGGTYQAYGQKLSIDRGAIAFNGLVENPRLDIEATRPNTDVRVGVTVTGTAANPRIRLFSEPELSEVDKLSWLVLGRATDGLGRTDTALLQRAALALLAGEGEGVTDRLTRAIGLDEVSLRQTDGEVRETVISLGKQLSRRWYVGYERGLNATAGSWQLIYRVAQRLTLRAQSGFENSLDVIWTWRWQ